MLRSLWRRCKAGPISEADVVAVVSEGPDRAAAYAARWWRSGNTAPTTCRWPPAGCTASASSRPPARTAARSIRVCTVHSVQIKTVLHGGAC